MKHVNLGSTGMRICPIVFGTLPLGPLQAGLSPSEGGNLIRYALDHGINCLDTAALYGTYAHIRNALQAFSGKVYLISKTHAPDARQARIHVEEALREMGVERLDVVHLHGARLADPFVERADVFAELIRMKEEGKISHLGLSTHYIAAVYKAIEQPQIEVIHPLINKAGMGILDGSAQEMATAIKEASKAGKGIYAMKALAGGNLISQARESLRYVLGLDGVDALAVGMLSPEEVDANLQLLNGEYEDVAVWQKLEQRQRRVRIMEQFCKGCGACVPACASQGLSIHEGKVRLDEERCILCGYCAAACPEFIIRVI